MCAFAAVRDYSKLCLLNSLIDEGDIEREMSARTWRISGDRVYMLLRRKEATNEVVD